MKDTKQQFDMSSPFAVTCSKKLHDYGPAWRILRPASKPTRYSLRPIVFGALRLKATLVDEGIRSEFIAIVNYGIIGLIQLELDMPNLRI